MKNNKWTSQLASGPLDRDQSNSGQLLTSTEHHQLVFEWNNTGRDFDAVMLIHDLFEAQVQQTPHSVAVEFEDEQITYIELNARANRLAYYLKSKGVGPEVLVGIFVERSIEMVIGLLGIIKAGGAYLPLDPSYPSDRLKFMLKDAQVKLLLTQEDLEQKLPEHKACVVCIESFRGSKVSADLPNPAAETTPDNLAYVIYTSGSTGTPKGVMISHRSVCNHMLWMQETFPLDKSDRVLQKTPFSFDASVWEFYASLFAGARLIMARPDGHRDCEYIARVISEKRITVLQVVPSLLNLLNEEKVFANCTSLKRVFCGGEVLSTNLARSFKELSDADLINLYGPTEACIDSTFWKVNLEGDTDVIPIGRPVANTGVYILDSSLQDVPAGTVGEMYISGVQVARGYLNRPELTDERFMESPSGKGRMYRTGDLARHLPDGSIEYAGRIDDQVKIRGFRIEPGEIGAVLASHPALSEAVVTVREDQPGDKRLIAYVVLIDKAANLNGDLRDFLNTKLPDYMVPFAFVQLDSLPLMPNGKVDRKALPSPDISLPVSCDEYVLPETSTEEAVASIWEEVLDIDRAGIKDSFFDLGGHSLLAVKVISRCREQFKTDVPVTAFFNNPTVAGLADIIDRSSHGNGSNRVLSVKTVNRDMELPLSFAQERIWFINEMNPGSLAYNFETALRLKGELNIEALEQSLNEILRRHEIYRTTFHSRDGRPFQKIHEFVPIELDMIEIDEVNHGSSLSMADKIISEEYKYKFNLSKLPLVYWKLLRLNQEEHILVHVEHHIVHDGWSLNIFLDELTELYNAYCNGNQSTLDDGPVQFADYAYWQREWIKTEEAGRQLDYWKKKLTGYEQGLDLPFDRKRPPVQTFNNGETLLIDLDPALCESLRSLSRSNGASLYMTMLACFLTLIYRYSGKADLCVGAGIANRRLKEIEGVMGMIVNTMALRVDLSGDPSFLMLLRHVREVCLGAYANQDIPFEKVVEAIHPKRSLSYSPLYQVMFSFHDSPLGDMKLEGLEAELIEGLSQSAKADLNIIVIPRSEQSVGQCGSERNKGITLLWEYNADLFDPETIIRMVGHYQKMLKGITAIPEMKLSELPILTDTEKHQLLVEWNDTGTDYPRNKCIQQLFEEHAYRTPDVVALEMGERRLTYNELNSRSNRLANYLIKKGVSPDVLVGICIERSPEMVIGILAILKAGGAYVPLDSEYPKERLGFMLEDTGIALLLTQSSLSRKFPPERAPILCLDTDWNMIERESDANPPTVNSSEHLAYVTYTSGSTGMPKGISVKHRGVVRLVYQPNYVDITADDVFLQFAPVTFDASTFEIWGCLLNGARLTIPPPGKLTIEELGMIIQKYKVSTLWLTAGLFHLMTDERLEDLKCVRNLLAGGDVLSASHVRRFTQTLQDCRLINGYGPTENTTFTCCYTVPHAERQGDSVPIGRAVSNTSVFILDNHLQPVPVGVSGELYIGGDGLAREYHNRPELTSDKFIPNHFSNEPGARLYRTGDLARYLPDGNIDFLGRLDNQVKIRGFRIEPGEIKSAIQHHPDVRESFVTVKEGRFGDKSLIAYVVLKEHVKLKVSELRNYLKGKLPDFMVPAGFIMLDSLPLTPNGKLDRSALPLLGTDRTDMNKTLKVPGSELEQRLARIWEKALGIQPIGTGDNFFELGGHSLLAVRLIAEIKKTTGKYLSVMDFFNSPTIEEIAVLINGQEGTASDSSVIPLQPHGPKVALFWLNDTSLVNQLDHDQPLFLLKRTYHDLLHSNNSSIESIAELFVRDLLVFQPEGPYMLGGYCFWGIVAIEMARQLVEMGHEVSKLIVLDPSLRCLPVNNSCAAAEKRDGPQESRMIYHLRHLKQLRFREKTAYILKKIYNLIQWPVHTVNRKLAGQIRKLKNMTCRAYLSLGYKMPHEMARSYYYSVNAKRILDKHRAPVYPGSIITINSDNNNYADKDWSMIADGEVLVHEVPGVEHLNMLRESNIGKWSKLVKACLFETQAHKLDSGE